MISLAVFIMIAILFK